MQINSSKQSTIKLHVNILKKKLFISINTLIQDLGGKEKKKNIKTEKERGEEGRREQSQEDRDEKNKDIREL